MTELDHITIVGAGAMGCLFAARLAAAGRQVVVVDTAADRLAVLARNGITLIADDGTTQARVTAATAAEAPETDLVILFTKGMHSAAAIRSVAHLATPGTCVLTLQNGLGNAEAIAEIFDPNAVLIGATDYPADLTGPATVATHGAGTIWLGPYAGADAAILDRVAGMLRSANLAARVDASVIAAIWEKVAFNAALNAIATITGLRVGEMDTPPGRRIADAVVREVVAVARARALALDADAIMDKIDFALTHHLTHKASMLQDREAGRMTEIESINGAIQRAASDAGLAVPATATLADLVRMIERPGAVASPR